MKTITLLYVFLNIHQITSNNCDPKIVKESLPFFNDLKNTYYLLTTANELQKSTCDYEEIFGKHYYFFQIDEFLDLKCNLIFQFENESHTIDILPFDEPREITHKVIKFSEDLEHQDFFNSGIKNCLTLIKEEKYLKKN